MAPPLFLEYVSSAPKIVYDPPGAWTDAPLISQRDVRVTSVENATASISFEGNGIQMFGTRRQGFGSYSITVDGEVIIDDTAEAAQISENQLLGFGHFPSGPHVAILRNTGSNTTIDLDRILIQYDPGGNEVQSVSVDDQVPDIAFTPPNRWETTNSTFYFRGTTHNTTSPEAKASLMFSGDAVAIYGSVGPDHADLEVEIDGRSEVVSMGPPNRLQRQHPKVLLVGPSGPPDFRRTDHEFDFIQYFHDKLGPQQHNLTIQSSTKTNKATAWDLDYIQLWAASNHSRHAVVPNPASNPGSSQVSSAATVSHKGLITGLCIFFPLLILVVFVTIFFVLRRRRRIAVFTARPTHPHTPSTPNSLELPLQSDPEVQETRASQLTLASQSGTRAPSSYKGVSTRPPSPDVASSLGTLVALTEYDEMAMDPRVPMRPVKRPPQLQLKQWR